MDDLHDAHDDNVEYLEEEYYSDGSCDDGVGGDYAEDANDYDGMDDDIDDDTVKKNRPQRNYTILKEEDIRKRQEDDITTVSTLLSVSKVWASILLRNFHWRVSTVQEEWFSDEDRVRQTVGLFEKPGANKKPTTVSSKVTCGICFERCRGDDMTHSTAGCGHRYCNTCWGGYISTSIKDGPGCLFLRCPDPECNAAIDQDMIDKLASVSDDDKHKYSRYLFRSYIEDNRKTKWCPAPGCDFAVEFVACGDGNYDVSCLCSHGFCWNCNEESHRPVDCETVSKWLIKHSAESENMNWILANSKQCPKCKRPIEKNQGCMHMTCSSPCRFEFCWLCLGPWSKHGQATGGYRACNIYEAARQDGTFNEEERRREMAKHSLEKYMHYHERWATNLSSKKKALADLLEMQNVKIEKLSCVQCQSETQLVFLTEAWIQIVECRRVLEWSYAYGYYLPEQEQAKKNLFEYLQGEAESGLERLHQCAENELEAFLAANCPLEGFNAFRTKLTDLTSVTKTYFENLVRALENGLSDVYSHGASCIQTASSKKASMTKKRKRSRREG